MVQARIGTPYRVPKRLLHLGKSRTPLQAWMLTYICAHKPLQSESLKLRNKQYEALDSRLVDAASNLHSPLLQLLDQPLGFAFQDLEVGHLGCRSI